MVDRLIGGVELDEIDHVEARLAEQPEELAVRQLPLHAHLARPFETTEPPLRAQQRLGRGALVGRAEDRQRAVAEEPEPPARAKEPMRLGNPAIRIAPDARPVLGDREIEALRGQRNVLRTRLDEWELDPELLLASAGRLELSRRHVDPDGRAPRFASQAETYAVPQPSSTTSSPSTSPSVSSGASGIPKTPQVISSAAQLELACASV